jgi:hypothetical protein
VIDSLDVRLFRHAAPSNRLYQDAAVFRALIAAHEPGDPAQFVQLPGLGTFRIKPGGSAPYEFVLINPQIGDIRIWNVSRWHTRAAAQTGQMYISFRSVFLQRGGLDAARRTIQALTDLYCVPGEVWVDAGPEFDRVARVDLAADTQESRNMIWADLDRYVCKARKLDTWSHLTPASLEALMKNDFEETALPQEIEAAREGAMPAFMRSAARVLHAHLRVAVSELETYGQADVSRVVKHNRTPQTVYFGRFGSQLYARRYNKKGSLVTQNKLYMLDIWRAAGWDDESPVWRTEFSLSGDFLKDYRAPGIVDCRDLGALDQLAPVLWDYLTCDWLRLADQDQDDVNRSRWTTAPEWQTIQGALGSTDLVGARDHVRTVPVEDDHLVLQARGCSVSTVALRANALGSVEDALQSMMDEFIYNLTDEAFADDVNKRMLDFGLDDFSDTVISALIRRERLKEAVGT